MPLPTFGPSLQLSGTYKISPPALTTDDHHSPSCQSNAWTLTLQDFTHHPGGGISVWGTFDFADFKGIIMIDRMEVPPSSAHSLTTNKLVHRGWDHAWALGQKLHFRWRGGNESAAPSTYALDDCSPHTQRRLVPTTSIPSASLPPTAMFSNKDFAPVASSIPRAPSWAGEGEITFVSHNGFALVFCNQGQIWQLDGARDMATNTGNDERGEPYNSRDRGVVDGYGRSWYDLFWLSERRGDWVDDPDADALA